MFQRTKEWANKVNLSSFELENFFKFGACVISARKAKQLDATTMFTYSHANTALGQSERAYYLSYFITSNRTHALYVQIFNIQNYILFKGEGLTRKGPNAVTFWVSNCYDMCSLSGRRLNGKGKGAGGAREKRGTRAARFSRAWPETPFHFQTPAKQATICVVSCCN